MQILNERADAAIEDGKVLLFAQEDGGVGPPLSVPPAVPVPLAVIQRDHPRTGLDQPAGHEQTLGYARSAVAVHEDLRIPGAVAFDAPAVSSSTLARVGQLGGGE